MEAYQHSSQQGDDQNLLLESQEIAFQVVQGFTDHYGSYSMSRVKSLVVLANVYKAMERYVVGIFVFISFLSQGKSHL